MTLFLGGGNANEQLNRYNHRLVLDHLRQHVNSSAVTWLP